MMYDALCAEFYDADKKYASQEEVDFYTYLFNETDIILELMCGSGRLLIPLLQAGYTVHGCDNSVAMLQSCRERAEKLGLQPKLFDTNLETMDLEGLYDGIIIPLGSFQLLYPRAAAFKVLDRFKKHLRPKGRLIMDLFVPWDALSENNQQERGEREIQISDGSSIKCIYQNNANKQEQFIASENKYIKKLNDNIISEEIEHMHICWYYRYEMELILEKYGFKNISMQERFLNNENHMTFIAENN